jgi:hypothetical protein
MSNEELAKAIEATWRAINYTAPDSEMKKVLLAHHRTLISEQARRAVCGKS